MTTATKTPVQAKWTPTQVQERTARLVAGNMLAAMQVLSKYGDQAITEFQDAARKYKVEYLKDMGVKTPFELVKALGEIDANIYGSKIEISGDEKEASLTYNACAMWNAIKEVGKLTPQQEEGMGSKFQACMTNLGNEFHLKTDLRFEGDTCVVNFKKQ